MITYRTVYDKQISLKFRLKFLFSNYLAIQMNDNEDKVESSICFKRKTFQKMIREEIENEEQEF